jgi:hypothetical protein
VNRPALEPWQRAIALRESNRLEHFVRRWRYRAVRIAAARALVQVSIGEAFSVDSKTGKR